MKRTKKNTISTDSVVAYIREYYADNGFMPTQNEMAQYFEKSYGWAWNMIRKLEKLKKIKRTGAAHEARAFALC